MQSIISLPVRLQRLSPRRLVSLVGWILCGIAFLLVAIPLLDILYVIIKDGLAAFSVDLFTQVTNGISGGLLNAITGTLVLTAGALIIGTPIGVAAGVYLSEFGHGGFSKIVRFLGDVLTGVPSIVLGYFSYVTMVVTLGWQFSVLAGTITLAMMIVPYIARFTELSLLQVRHELREAGYALGTSEIRVVARIVFPIAWPGVLTGILLSMAISVGETAPLIYTAGWSNYLWNGHLIREPIGYLTYVIWSFINQPFESAHALAFAAAFLVIVAVLLINTGARLLLKRPRNF